MSALATACSRLLAGYCVLLFLFVPGTATAQAGALAIAPENGADTVVIAAPRSLVAVALRVTNHSGAAGDFDATLALPPGWRTLAPDAPFTLARGASTVRLVNVFVPEAAAAGAHTLTYSVRNRAVPASGGAYAVRLHVTASVKLALTLLDMPEMVVAGAAYTATFLLKNGGNAPVTADYKALSSRGHAFDLAPGAVTLAPGAAHTFSIRVTSAPVDALERDYLVLTARTDAAHGAVMVRATGVVKLIPRVTGAERRYDTVPATAALRYVSADDNGRRRGIVQAEIAGGGKLGETGARYLDFLLRGPGASTASGFGQLAEYRVAYRDPRLALGLGDLTYGLSPLTEAGSAGRGVSASYQGDSVAVLAYAMRDRYARVDQPVLPASGPIAGAVEQLAALTAAPARTALSEQAAGLRYASGVGLLGVNVMHKTDYRCPAGGEVASISDEAGSPAGLSAQAELGESRCAGATGKAYRVALADRRYRLTWRAAITHADALYLGYNPDQALALFQAEYPLTAALTLHASYRSQTTNFARDLRRAALDEQQTSAGVGYQFANGAHADADYVAGSSADLRPRPDYDATRQALRVSLWRQYQGLGLYGSASLGATQDRVRQTSFPARQLLTSAFWTANRQLSVGANLYYIDNAYTTRREAAQTSLGATLRYAHSGNTLVEANVQESRAGVGGSSANLALSHRLSNGDVMTLAMRRLRFGATRQGDLMVSYAMPVAVPVGKRHNIATVTGRVLDQATGRGLPGKVLRLGGILAVSAANGAFSFPSIPVGTYYLSMDDVDGAGGAIPLEAMPMAVAVREGADPRLDISLVQAAMLTGTVALAAPGDAALRNVLVTFRKTGVEFRRMTDAAGAFRLGSIAPGQWTVAVDLSTLPAGYELEQDQFVVDLAPAGAAAVAFQLKARVRTIKMQELLPVGR